MSRSLFLLTCFLVAQISNVEAAISIYGQCGGDGYAGETICTPPNECAYWNQYYAQCLPPGYPGPTYTKIVPSVTPSPISKSSTRSTATSACVPTTSGLVGFMSNAIVAAGSSTSTPLYLNQLQASGNPAVLSSTRMQGGLFGYATAPSAGYLRIACSYLTVDEVYPYSYKPLSWTSQAITNYWVVDTTATPYQGGPLSTSSTSPYGVRSTFLSCGNSQLLYLQTGNDLPSTKCKTVTLNLEIYM